MGKQRGRLKDVLVVQEWIDREYKNNMPFMEHKKVFAFPVWFGKDEFHRSHRSNLVRKKPEFYGELFADVDGSLPYVWPV